MRTKRISETIRKKTPKTDPTRTNPRRSRSRAVMSPVRMMRMVSYHECVVSLSPVCY